MLRELLVGLCGITVISTQLVSPTPVYATENNTPPPPVVVQEQDEPRFEHLLNEFDNEYQELILASLKPDDTVIENADEFLIGLMELPEENYTFLIETIPKDGITETELDLIEKLSELQTEKPELFEKYYEPATLDFLIRLEDYSLLEEFLELEFPAEHIQSLPSEEETLADLIKSEDNIKVFLLDKDGRVPVLMYHHVGVQYYVTPERFRNHLQTLYDHGFSLISVEDFLEGDFSTIPNGRKPLILSFDDGWRDNLNYIDGEIDPDCVVGLLNDFYETNPDFNFEAIFFVSFDKLPFGQRGYVDQKMNQLLDMGLEIGNHTNTHAWLSRLTDEGVKEELDLAMAKFEYYLGPRVSHVVTLAYPYGAIPNNLDVIKNYDYNGVKLLGAFDAWGGTTPNPFNESFDNIRIKRITANDDTVSTVANNTGWMWYGRGCMVIKYEEIRLRKIYLVSEDVFLDYMKDKVEDFDEGTYYHGDYIFTVEEGELDISPNPTSAEETQEM